MSGDSPRDEVPPAERARQRGASAADRAAQTATRMRELSDDRQLGGHLAAPAARQAMLAKQRLAVASERVQAAAARAAAAREAAALAHDRAAALYDRLVLGGHGDAGDVDGS
ncbi:MAG TPA: hypothetical protein VFM01_18640 [Nakamurella sp.]|nr:hypothetical protein [Nakamurella sp.]